MVMDRLRSHLHAGVKPLLPEVFEKIESGGREILVEEVDLGRIVGKTTCVKTSQDDEILWERRDNRKGFTRFVLGREPEDSSSVVIVLKQADEAGVYVCLTAYIGTYSEPEPWDKRASAESEAFWENHAMVWGVD